MPSFSLLCPSICALFFGFVFVFNKRMSHDLFFSVFSRFNYRDSFTILVMNDIHSYIFIQSFIHSGHEIDVRIHLLTDGQLLINHILKSCRDFFAIIFFTQYNSREISYNEELGQVHASLLYNGVIFKKKNLHTCTLG